MPGGDREVALDAIQAIASSPNSVSVYSALADGVSTSRALAEEVDASRSTVARILDDGESRGWVESTGSQYALTNLGEAMLEEFLTYLETVAGIQHLGEALNYLPEPAHDLDVRHLRDATIVTPSREWPQAHVNRGMELYRTRDTYRGLTNIAPDVIVQALADLVEAGDLELEGVIEAAFIEELRTDPERAAPWHAFADSIWVYDGEIPINMHVLDETFLLWLSFYTGEEWDIYGMLESEHEAVVSWAESLYEEYKAAAEPLDPATLPDP